jgi:hypothetical protein
MMVSTTKQTPKQIGAQVKVTRYHHTSYRKPLETMNYALQFFRKFLLARLMFSSAPNYRRTANFRHSHTDSSILIFRQPNSIFFDVVDVAD